MAGGSIYVYRSATEETMDAAMVHSRELHSNGAPIIKDVVQHGFVYCFGGG